MIEKIDLADFHAEDPTASTIDSESLVLAFKHVAAKLNEVIEAVNQINAQQTRTATINNLGETRRAHD